MSFKDKLYRNRHIMTVSVCFTLAVLMAGLLCDVDPLRFLAIAGTMIIQIFIIPLFYVCAAMLAFFVISVLKEKSLMAVVRATHQKTSDFVASDTIQDGLSLWLAIAPLMIFFCIWKSLIPQVAFLQWDQLFAHVDFVLHGRRYPHEWLLPFVQRWNLERFFEYIYMAWFFLLFAINTYAMFFDRKGYGWRQYLWSYVITWIIGGAVLATVFYSVGPVFYGEFYPGLANPYAGLLDWLSNVANGQPAFSLTAANFLYETSYDDLHPDINGISAMPSMHVAITWLMTLYAFKVRRIFGVIMLAYTALLLIASIVLGWHYAIDGYAGILMTSLVWFVVGRNHKNMEK